eukprot:TRINITY_DN4768_c0_g1_i1.p1 TRINITY_DN4768_c0_g1~~TRINITY_DN4768_c0_g1_i1.p1  ORF type:complete len:448 (-),score=142.85 TRINITY_DN4768_c0_g1_i1:91-1332(-)
MADDMDMPDGVDEMDLPDGVDDMDDDMDTPDGLVLDEEDKAIVAEVKKKGYYHARPKTETCAAPTRLAVSHSPLGGDQKVEKRSQYDAFQKKWDNIEVDSDEENVKVTSSSARISSSSSSSADKKSALLGNNLSPEDAKKLLQHYKSNPNALLNDTDAMKRDGAKYFKEGDMDKALEFWGLAKRAIKQINDEELFKGNKEKQEETRNLETVINANMAAVYLKQEKFNEAIDACNIALKNEPEHAKALFRKASACFATLDTEGARVALKALLKQEPNHVTARQMLQDVKQKEEASKTKLFEGSKKKQQLLKATKQYKAEELDAAKETLTAMLAEWPDHEGAQKLMKEIVDKQKAEKAAAREAAKKMFSGLKADPRIAAQEKKEAVKKQEDDQLDFAENPMLWLKAMFCPRRKQA